MRDYKCKNIEHIYECEKESSKLTLEVRFFTIECCNILRN